MIKIYFEGAEKAKNLTELFQIGYGEGSKFLLTYWDKELTQKQCHKARRSMDDLLLIANTYFENTTEADIIKALNNYSQDEASYFVCFYCNDVRKPVYERFVFHYKDGYHGYNIVGKMAFVDNSLKGSSKYNVNQLKELTEETLITG